MNIWREVSRVWRQEILNEKRIQTIEDNENIDFEVRKKEISKSKTAGSILDDILNDDFNF